MSGAPASKVAFKVCLHHSKETVFHRFSGTYTLAEFQSVISHLWGGVQSGWSMNTLGLEYQDPDGDMVKLGCTFEWEEALRLWAESQQGEAPVNSQSSPLRIFVRRLKKKERKVVEELLAAVAEGADSSSTGDEEEEGGINVVGSAPTAPVIPKLSLPSEEAGPVTNVTFEEPELGGVVELLSTLFHCNAAEKLYAGNEALFQGVVKRVPEGEEVHLDIDRQAMYRAVVRIGNQALDERDFQRAETVYRCALQDTFCDNMLLEYNLACALALQGEEQEDDALAWLSLAVDHGYDSLRHMAQDPDLATLRGLPAFSALCGAVVTSSLLPTSDLPPTVVSPRPATLQVVEREAAAAKPATAVGTSPVVHEVPDVAPSSPSDVATPNTTPESGVPVSPVRPLAPSVQSLLSVFPHLSVAEAELALRRSSGNLALAVNTLLNAPAV